MDPGPTLYHHPNEILEGAFKAELQQSRIIVMASIKDQKKTVCDLRADITHMGTLFTVYICMICLHTCMSDIYIYMYIYMCK